MIQPTFLFYDYETFGKNPLLDRPVQFACIRTDIYFNLIDPPSLIYCQPPSDYLPQPEAVMITEITPQIAFKYGMIEAHFAQYINNIFLKPQTCIIGYNNLRFDDEITRNLFYRNFYDPYAWSWKNYNSRLDLLSIVRACYAIRPEGIIWSYNKNKSINFSLHKIAETNNILNEKAHDALSDVFTTLAIAKLVQNKQPRFFNFIFEYRFKKKLISLINIDHMYPLINIIQNNVYWIVPVSWHPNNSNILITVDLSGDLNVLFDLTDNELQEKICNERTNSFHMNNIPIRFIYINKCPILLPGNILRYQDIERLGINHKLCSNNLLLLRSQPSIKKKIINLFKKDKFQLSISTDVDEQLYAGFFNESDRKKMNIIKDTKPDKLSAINFNFTDKRIYELLFRYKARNFPTILNKIEKNKWFEHKRNIFNDQKIQKFFLDLENLSVINKDNKNKLNLINDLYNYIEQIITLNNI